MCGTQSAPLLIIDVQMYLATSAQRLYHEWFRLIFNHVVAVFDVGCISKQFTWLELILFFVCQLNLYGGADVVIVYEDGVVLC